MIGACTDGQVHMMIFMIAMSTHTGSNLIYMICYHPGFDAEKTEAQPVLYPGQDHTAAK